MRRKGKWILAVTFSLGLLVTLANCAPKPPAAQDSCGFSQNVYGQRQSWKGNLPIIINAHNSVPAKYIPALQAAIATWNRTAGKEILRFGNANVAGALAATADHNNMVYWFTNAWDRPGIGEQARTNLYTVGADIREADIRINAQEFEYYWRQQESSAGSVIEIETIFEHELGHVLGLAHAPARSSVMYAGLAYGQTRVEPTASDKTNLACEY